MPDAKIRTPPLETDALVSTVSDDRDSNGRVRTSVHMIAVIQWDYADQMTVFDWILHDKQYRAFAILHDRDIYEEDGERVSGITGETIKHKAGEVKAPHYHLYVKLQKKLSAATFSKRFGNYVHFQICADPLEKTRYFLHETFDSRAKAHYDRSELQGDIALAAEYLKSAADDDSLSICRRFLEAVEDNTGDECAAVRALIASGDLAAVKSVMSHPYFYSRFLSKGGK